MEIDSHTPILSFVPPWSFQSIEAVWLSNHQDCDRCSPELAASIDDLLKEHILG